MRVKVTVGVSMDEKVIRVVNSYARKAGVSRSKVIQWAVDEYLKKGKKNRILEEN